MSNVDVFVALAVGLALLVVWLLARTSKTREHLDKMPGPPALPLFGNVLIFKRGGAGEQSFL